MSDLKFTNTGDYMAVDYSLHVLYTRHGGAYDRGMADSYYRRERQPHYFKGDTYHSDRITEMDMSADEVAAYNQGYDDNERSGVKKGE